MSESEPSGVLVAGRYRLGPPLGQGGMGQVYRATDEVLHRKLAIKLMLPPRQGSAASQRFLREARAAARIIDPHVVATFDFGPHDGGSYLAMELVEGHSLGEELRQTGPLPPQLATDIVRQAAAGLAAAHQQGVVHRDIKPGNLLISADGTVKVADFGIARVLNDTTITLTAVGQIVGTSYYLAPERALDKPADAAADVYSLGCVFYQMVTGRPPFIGEDPAAILYQHVEQPPAAPSEHRRELSRELDALVLWMLAKDPAERPTAVQVATGATPPPLPEARQDTADLAAIAPLATSIHHREHSRRLLAGAGALTALVMSAAVGALLGLNNLQPPPTNLVPPDSIQSPTQTTEPTGSRSSRPATAPASTARKTATKPRTTSSPASPGGADPSRRVTLTPEPTKAATPALPSVASSRSSNEPSTTAPSPTETAPATSPVATTSTPSTTPFESTSTPSATPNQTSTSSPPP